MSVISSVIPSSLYALTSRNQGVSGLVNGVARHAYFQDESSDFCNVDSSTA